MTEEIFQITVLCRPHKLEEVKTAVAIFPITGMSVSDVRGCGNNPETRSPLIGQDVIIALPAKSKLVVVVAASIKDQIVDAMLEAAHTGAPGDGKIFVEKIADAIRIRTEERGLTAV